jgi:iron complex outermembrane receptor protein
VETALETKLPGGLMGRVSYSYQETNDEEQDTRLSNSPRHLGKLNLSVPLWKDKIFSGIELQYHGDVKSLNDRTINDYVLVNLTLYSQKIAKNLDASISVYNVFDQRYYHPGAGEHLTQGMYRIEQDGITWWLKFNYRF